MDNVIKSTVISQWANSPVFTSLIQTFNDAIDPAVNFEDFYSQIWDVDTATGYGLDVWGRIVGVNRTLQITSTGTGYFGFREAGEGKWKSFREAGAGGGPLWNGSPKTNTIVLSDSDFRTLIYIKALANITDCSIPSLNLFLRRAMTLFGLGDRAYVTVLGPMSLSYTIEYALNSTQKAILENSGAVPTPCGVSVTIVTA